MHTLSLRMKIWLGFGSVLLILALVVGYDILQVQNIRRLSVDTAANVDARRNLNFLRLSVEKRIAALRGYLIQGNPVFLTDYQKATSDCTEGMEGLARHADSPEEQELFKSLEAGLQPYIHFQDGVMEMGWEGKSKEALEKTSSQEFLDARNSFQNGGGGIQKYFVQSADRGAADDKKLIRGVQTTVVGLLVVGLAIGAMVAVAMARGVIGPVRKMMGLINQISANNLAVADLEVSSSDELGQAVTALNRMKNNLSVVIQSVASNAQAVASSSEELSSTSEQMSANAEETSSQANVVSAADEQVNRSLQTVAAGSEQMGASIREIAKNASEAAKVATEAVRFAENTNATISKLGDSSAEIGQVVKVITSIAQQTNLLALNPTIEAARAGEAGKGFAVVANEVKELARQTSKATEDITRKIAAIQGDAKSAVSAIAMISSVIGQISDFSSTIATAVEEQDATTSEMSRNINEAARGANEITKNIAGVAEAAQSTSHGATDSHKAAGQVAQKSAELHELVGKFRIDFKAHATGQPAGY